MAILSLDHIRVGDSYSEEIQLDTETIARFVGLTQDRTGIHVNKAISEENGFANIVVHGFLLAVQFSRILGMKLPGQNSVIGSIELNFHAPVYVGDTLKYTATVKRLLPPLGSVALNLKIEKPDGTICVAGKATCAFRNKSR